MTDLLFCPQALETLEFKRFSGLEILLFQLFSFFKVIGALTGLDPGADRIT